MLESLCRSQHVFGVISAVGPPNQLSWITKLVINRFFASDQLLISHDFWISGERQIIIRLDVWDQLSRRNNVSPRIKPATLRLHKSDALSIELIRWAHQHKWNSKFLCYNRKQLYSEMLTFDWKFCKWKFILIQKICHEYHFYNFTNL